MRWEVATAIAGAVIGIDLFDQPNVQESKDNTSAVLKGYLESGDFGVALTTDPGAEVAALIDGIEPGDYFAVLAYTEPGEEVDAALAALRSAVRDRFGVATTVGYGPRYLHSTGQLHKGGPNTGVYLILSDERGDDLPIPEEQFGFKTLVRAQWLGDLKSLRDHDRRVAQMTMDAHRVSTISQLTELVTAPAAKPLG
jgi:glucose-6-phosphate isomerase/transaldolase/glucose-6-phosphate isomerase